MKFHRTMTLYEWFDLFGDLDIYYENLDTE
jgi:hypothetical protein